MRGYYVIWQDTSFGGGATGNEIWFATKQSPNSQRYKTSKMPNKEEFVNMMRSDFQLWYWNFIPYRGPGSGW